MKNYIKHQDTMTRKIEFINPIETRLDRIGVGLSVKEYHKLIDKGFAKAVRPFTNNGNLILDRERGGIFTYSNRVGRHFLVGKLIGNKKIFKITSEINHDVEYLETMEEANNYIKAELKSANIHEKQNPYKESDFSVSKLNLIK